jgi:hypothetical protein
LARQTGELFIAVGKSLTKQMPDAPQPDAFFGAGFQTLEIGGLAFNRDFSRLVVTGDAGRVAVYDWLAGRLLTQYCETSNELSRGRELFKWSHFNELPKEVAANRKETWGPKLAFFLRDDSILVCGCSAANIKLATGGVITMGDLFGRCVTVGAGDENGRMLVAMGDRPHHFRKVSFGEDPNVALIDPAKSAILNVGDFGRNVVALGNCGDRAAILHHDFGEACRLSIVDTAKKNPPVMFVHEFPLQTSFPFVRIPGTTSFAFMEFGRDGANVGQLQRIDVAAGRVESLRAETPIGKLIFAPDGRLFIVGTGRISVLSGHKWESTATFDAPECSSPSALAVDSRRRLLAIGQADGSILKYQWELKP